MSKPEDGKMYYDHIEIPDEVEDVVNTAILSVDKESARKKYRRRLVMKGLRYGAAAAAALLLCMTVGLNTNEVFAKGMSELPVIGPLAKVLTIRSYEEKTEDFDISVNVPEIQIETPSANAENGLENLTDTAFVGDINKEIERIVEQFIEQSKQDYADYKKAFFETGGTEEEWADRNMDIDVNYEVKYQEGSVLSLVLTVDKGWVNAYGERYYYNLDLKGQRQLTLKDVMGDDYQKTANESIFRQMRERLDADENSCYWGMGAAEDDLVEGFKTVDESTKFYLNSEGKPVVCFEKYEVAPGYMGVQEFEIG